MGDKEIKVNRVKLFFSVTILMLAVNCLFSQEKITAVKEKITSLKLGSSELELSYECNEEGFYSPKGPMIDEKGNMLLYPEAGNGAYDYLLQIDHNGTVSKRELFPIMKEWGGATSLQLVSQQGYIQLNNVCIDLSESGYGSAFYPHEIEDIPVSRETRYYPLPFGSYMESISPPFIYSTEAQNGHTMKVRNLEETRKWLSTQPSGFSVGEDGLLYRNGMVWSAKQPDGYPGEYLGRLASGHAIWGSDSGVGVRKFYITNSKGEIEADLYIPWASDEKRWSQSEGRPYNYGIGPWGEIYCLIPPPYKAAPDYVAGPDTLEFFTPDTSKPAELVVVRNHLKYFGRLNDDKVRLRKGPSTSTESLGSYPVKTGFRILEKGTAEETIGGQKNVWYKVRLLDGTEGWFFGAFVHNLYDGPDGNPPPWPNVADW
jgi:hypothetical protein